MVPPCNISFEAGDGLLPAPMRRLFAAGGTPGRARPKVLVSEPTGDWIAKFPSPARDRHFDIVGLERLRSTLPLAPASRCRIRAWLPSSREGRCSSGPGYAIRRASARCKVGAIMKAQSLSREYADYLDQLRAQFKPKRNFIKLLDALA